VATLRRDSFYHAGDQWMLHFEEKGGKSREIPVRHDLEQMIFEYISAEDIDRWLGEIEGAVAARKGPVPVPAVGLASFPCLAVAARKGRYPYRLLV